MRERTLSVQQLNAYIKGVFEDELVLHDLNVEGEVYEFKQTAGNTFLVLRENDGLLQCVCFGITEILQAGDTVRLFGSVRFYERSGKISFVFKSVRKTGKGNLLAEFNALRDRLRLEGLFDRKREIASPIRRIAVITAETGAVIHDFIRTVHRKREFTDIMLYPSAVQGRFAVSDIVSGLRQAEKLSYDAIVIARGGGSNDDLSVFNDETLVRAVAACSVPVISAVGHETDFTLCDFAAAVRAGTPSMAGEYISRRNEEFFARFSDCVARIERNTQSLLTRKINRLYRSAANLTYKSELESERVRMRVRDTALRIDGGVREKYGALRLAAVVAGERITASTEEKQSGLRERTAAAIARLDAGNPLRILSMGYARLRGKSGNVTFDNTRAGDAIEALTAEGTLFATVTGKKRRER